MAVLCQSLQTLSFRSNSYTATRFSGGAVSFSAFKFMLGSDPCSLVRYKEPWAVFFQDFRWPTGRHDPTSIEPDHAIAHGCQHRQRVGNNDQSGPVLLHLQKARHAFLVERCVSDSEYLVDQQNIGVDMNGNCKSKPHVHSCRISLDRAVN